MKFFIGFILAVFCVLCLAPRDAAAVEVSQAQFDELVNTVRQLQKTVDRQQIEINELKRSKPVDSHAMPGHWNPDIGVVADVVLMADSPRADTEGADRVSVREMELTFGSAVDPYSRLDATVSFSDFEEAALEEAYYTHFGLPLDVTGRVGRFKPNFGKALTVHRDSLDTVDEPIVIRRYFGVEGYNKSGADLKKTLDLPGESTHQLSLGLLEGGNGEGGTLFGDTRRHPTIYSHLKNYWDLNDSTGLELGASHLVGSRDDDSTFEVNVIGLDGTLVHELGDERHFKLQSEVFHVNRTESFIETTDSGTLFYDDLDNNRNLWGGYILADLRFLPKWATGFRFDRVQLVDALVANPDSADVGYTSYLTFHQSEFARWRVQFSHLDLADGNNDDQILIQGTFAIGEHKHKI